MMLCIHGKVIYCFLFCFIKHFLKTGTNVSKTPKPSLTSKTPIDLSALQTKNTQCCPFPAHQSKMKASSVNYVARYVSLPAPFVSDCEHY